MVDGWRLQFDKFLVVVGDVLVQAGHDDAPAIDDAAYRVFDLAQGSEGDGHALLSAEVPGALYEHVGYRIAPAEDATAGNAAAGDVELMASMGWAIYIEGTATKADVTKTFAWGFDGATGYDDCHVETELDGGEAAVQITVHGDHLFYDDAVSTEPNIAFDLVAQADADDDGAVTETELAAVELDALERYQVGSLDIANLWEYIDYQTGTLGHIDGEGHCESITRE
jgi:hypothetical protein